jgi:ABC-2 type transport system permease protein
MLRALRSELLKFRRWSVLAGVGVMIAASAGISYLTFHQITSGATGRELTELIVAFPTTLGLLSVVGQARSLIIAVTVIMVTANIAAEWSQGTLRNLLIRQPRRLRLLAGKVAALLLLVTVSGALTLVVSAALIIGLARSQGISTDVWTSAEAANASLVFAVNELLALVGISLLGVLVAVLTRSTGAAVGVALAYVLVPEGLVAMVWLDASRWLPVRVFNYLPGSVMPTGIGPTPPQGYGEALIVAFVWMASFIALSAFVFRRHDVVA